MDFIERFLGISPDGGDGSLEALYLAVAAVAIAAFVFRGRIVRFLRDRAASSAGKGPR